MGLFVRAPGPVLVVLGFVALFDGGWTTALGLGMIACGALLWAAQVNALNQRPQ